LHTGRSARVAPGEVTPCLSQPGHCGLRGETRRRLQAPALAEQEHRPLDRCDGVNHVEHLTLAQSYKSLSSTIARVRSSLMNCSGCIKPNALSTRGSPN